MRREWAQKMPRLADGAAGCASPAAGTRLRLLPLAVAIAITGAITVYPFLATTPDGRADHLTAVLLLWSMSAGYVRGVGFVPRHVLPRGLLSNVACGAALTAALLRIAG